MPRPDDQDDLIDLEGADQPLPGGVLMEGPSVQDFDGQNAKPSLNPSDRGMELATSQSFEELVAENAPLMNNILARFGVGGGGIELPDPATGDDYEVLQILSSRYVLDWVRAHG